MLVVSLAPSADAAKYATDPGDRDTPVKRPGHVVVTTEVAVCTFCGRPRTLRREAHQLGALVRTIVTCETCHRTLSSTIAVGTTEPAVEPVAEAAEPAAENVSEPAPDLMAVTPPAARKQATKPRAKTTKAAPQRKPAAPKATASKSRAPKPK